MAARNYKMVHLTRGKVSPEQRRVYMAMPLSELRENEIYIKDKLDEKFSAVLYDRLGVVRSAIQQYDPRCIKLPQPKINEGVRDESKWRTVAVREG